MHKLNGIGASGGIAIAKALIFEQPKITIKNTGIKNAKVEIQKLEKVKDQSVDELKKIIEKAKSKLTPEELQIFEAHMLIASDPFLMDSIKVLIEQNHVNGGYAIHTVFKNQEKAFLSMNDPYLSERAADVRDVMQRMLNIYYGVKGVDLSEIDEETIIVANDLTPSETSQLNKKFTRGFITNIGGTTSHSAIMARSMEIPAVLGLKTATTGIKTGDLLIIDGSKGLVIQDPSVEELAQYKKLADNYQKEIDELKKFFGKPSVSKDGHKVRLAANIGTPQDLDGVLKNDAEEVGLFRSEFLYMNQEDWPNEEVQFNAYKKVLEGMNGKRVIVRTLDIGGDKKLKYFQFPEEMNPFLGYRAIRLCLDRKDIFKTQLRALLRASKYGKLAIMFPMIAIVDEFTQAKEFLQSVHEELVKENVEVGEYEVGMMVEIPAAAMNIRTFAKISDFFSIGTNDLIQYSMAADRMSEKVSYLYRPLNPSILRLIYKVIVDAHEFGKPVGMCGELAGDLKVVPLLLGMGLDEFSMSASSILRVRKLLSQTSKKEVESHLDKILDLGTEKEVLSYLEKNFKLIYNSLAN